MSEKDFDAWNTIKIEVDKKIVSRDLFFYEREVWWSSLGLNIGVESDGKNESFERPVLVIKKFNSEMIWIIPLTSKEHLGVHYQKIIHEAGESWACLSQLKTISTKRLLRKIGMVSEKDFKLVVKSIFDYLKKIGPRISTGSSEAEATNTQSIIN